MPALYLWFTQGEGWDWWIALLAALGVVIVVRGIVDVVLHRFLPWPSLFGLDNPALREEDVVARRRAWFWRFWLKLAFVIVIIAIPVVLFLNGALLVQALPILLTLPLLLVMNFLILFGPLLIMNLSQIQAFEPGDAKWGVSLADVRGQAEAKEEVRRIVAIWQSGEQFESAGGKRERGLIFLGAPGTGKTMLAKAIATGFNSPFISIPGSGFAATFIGVDAIIVRILARRARKLARKWGGQCIVFIDEIDAVGMRRQALGGGQGGAFGGAGAAQPLDATDPSEFLFYGPWGAQNPSGDLVLETPLWRERMFAARAGVNATPAWGGGLARLYNFMFPGGMGGQGSPCAEPAARGDGRDRQPAVLPQALHEQAEHADGRHVHRPPEARLDQAAPAAGAAAQGADLLHRRDERPDRDARPRTDTTGTDGPPRVVPHADEARPPRHHRPVHREGRPCARPRHAEHAETRSRG